MTLCQIKDSVIPTEGRNLPIKNQLIYSHPIFYKLLLKYLTCCAFSYTHVSNHFLSFLLFIANLAAQFYTISICAFLHFLFYPQFSSILTPRNSKKITSNCLADGQFRLTRKLNMVLFLAVAMAMSRAEESMPL